MNKIVTRQLLAPLAFFLAIVLTACGGGGGGGGSGGAKLSGTAAIGAALAGATITVVDATGVSTTTTTDPNGYYTLPVGGLTPPFLVKVDDGSGHVLYSIGNAAGIANVHPLTDLIVRTWYEVEGTSVAAAFANPASNLPPTATELDVLTGVVVHVVQTWLVSAGLDPTTFNIFTTPFSGGTGTGFDGFLDTLTVDMTTPSAPVITVTSGTDSQTSNVTVAGTGDISVDTTITINGITGTTLTTAFVPTTAAAGEALTGVLTSLSAMADVVNTKGSALAGSDLLPFFDAGYLDFGLSQAQGADWMAQDMNGITLDAFVVDSILGYDAINNVMTIIGRATVSAAGVTATQYTNDEGLGLAFKKQGDGTWRFYGNQRKTKSHVSVNTVTNYTSASCTGCSGVVQVLQAQVMGLAGDISTSSASTVHGAFNGVTTTLDLSNDGTTTEKGVAFDQFNIDDGSGNFYRITSPENIPPAGSAYDFAITMADASTENYSMTIGAATQESITLQDGVENTVGHSWSAVRGHPVTLSWHLPTTFAIAEVNMHGSVSSATGRCDFDLPANVILDTHATTGTITMPTTCNGETIVTSPGYPSIDIQVKGINGEETDIWYAFDNA